MNETEEYYKYPEAHELKSYQIRQFKVWGLEALEREFWDRLERGILKRTPETMSYLTMLKGMSEQAWKALEPDNHKILYDEMLDQASMIL
jgi:hypothetical protein